MTGIVKNQEVTLIAPTEALRAEFFAMAEDYHASGEDRYASAWEDFSAYIRYGLRSLLIHRLEGEGCYDPPWDPTPVTTAS